MPETPEAKLPAEETVKPMQPSANVKPAERFVIPPRALRQPLISETDWEKYNEIHQRITSGEKDEERPGESSNERFSRHMDEGKTYSDVNYRVQEAWEINEARELAMKFGLDPELAEKDLVFRRDLKVAAQLFDELGLDGREVYADEEKRKLLQQLIGSEVRVAGNASSIMRAEKALEETVRIAQAKLDAERGQLEREQQSNKATREALLTAAGKNTSGEARVAVSEAQVEPAASDAAS